MKSQTISLAWAPLGPILYPFLIRLAHTWDLQSGWPLLLSHDTLSRVYTETEESSESVCKYLGHSVAAVL